MTGPHFVDSNVFVYQHDLDEPEKRARADQILQAVWRKRCGRVSVQVLSELYATCTRKLATPVDVDVIRNDVRALETWAPVPLSAEVRERAWQVEDRYGFSCWDSLIIAAAHEAGCRVLLTEHLGQ